uniref:Uncharacterized protein n=1 Tax=Glossina brevipalpis TaxID=37001 RepID=A0A1A9W1D7_9MUSC
MVKYLTSTDIQDSFACTSLMAKKPCDLRCQEPMKLRFCTNSRKQPCNKSGVDPKIAEGLNTAGMQRKECTLNQLKSLAILTDTLLRTLNPRSRLQSQCYRNADKEEFVNNRKIFHFTTIRLIPVDRQEIYVTELKLYEQETDLTSSKKNLHVFTFKMFTSRSRKIFTYHFTATKNMSTQVPAFFNYYSVFISWSLLLLFITP